MQGAGDEGRSCGASWAVGLVSELMQELHSQLCDTSVQLHREGNEGESVWLLSCTCMQFASEFPAGCGCSCRCCGGGEGVDGDALGLASRMSPQERGREGQPSTNKPGPSVRPGRRQRAVSCVEAMPAWCTARTVPVRMSWRSVVCAVRAEHRMPRSASVWCRVALQSHCMLGALGGSMARPSRRPAWISHLLSARALESGRAGKQTEAAEELGPGALAILGAGGKVGLQGICADLCGGPGERTLRLLMAPMVSKQASCASGRQRPTGVSCRVYHSDQNAGGPPRMARWVVAAAPRYVASLSAGAVWPGRGCCGEGGG
jgi:hypothetical protein